MPASVWAERDAWNDQFRHDLRQLGLTTRLYNLVLRGARNSLGPPTFDVWLDEILRAHSRRDFNYSHRGMGDASFTEIQAAARALNQSRKVAPVIDAVNYHHWFTPIWEIKNAH